jgi:predicted permease
MIGALMQGRSIVNQQAIDYGYDTEGLLSARMGLMDGDYPTPAARQQFYDRVLRELSAHQSFAAVGLTSRFQMVFSGSGPVEIDGKVYANKKDRPNANFEQVTGSFFGVTGQRLLEGRTFTEDDLDSRQPVAIVNAAFARKHYGTDSAIGRRFRTVDANTEQPGPWRTIVGVASTIRMLGPFNNPNVDDTGFYVPFYSNPAGPVQAGPFANQFATVVVKPKPGLRADALATVLQREVSKVDPNLPLYFVGTPKKNLDGFIAPSRIIVTMFSIFGAVAIVLAAVGIYGVTAFSVSQRTQEFGVRMALGADQYRILRMLLRQGGVQVAVGLFAGLGLAVLATTLAGKAIGNILFSVDPRDPVIFTAVAALVTLVALVATLVPARRATRVDPMTALRSE